MISLIGFVFRIPLAHWGCVLAFTPVAAILLVQSAERVAFILDKSGLDAGVLRAIRSENAMGSLGMEGRS